MIESRACQTMNSQLSQSVSFYKCKKLHSRHEHELLGEQIETGQNASLSLHTREKQVSHPMTLVHQKQFAHDRVVVRENHIVDVNDLGR